MFFNRHHTSAITRQDYRTQVFLIGLPLMVLGLLLLTSGAVSATETVDAGNLNGRALSLPPPVYPPLAKQSRVSGTVMVDIVVDESGKIESAKASSGPTLLKQAAVDAARKAKFSPTLKAGTPVKVSGFLQYTFKLD